jgi:hypothetical protein
VGLVVPDPPNLTSSLQRRLWIPYYAHNPQAGYQTVDIDLRPIFGLTRETVVAILTAVPKYRHRLVEWRNLSRQTRQVIAGSLIDDTRKARDYSVTYIEKYLLPAHWGWSLMDQQYRWLESAIEAIDRLTDTARSLNANARVEMDPTFHSDKTR